MRCLANVNLGAGGGAGGARGWSAAGARGGGAGGGAGRGRRRGRGAGAPAGAPARAPGGAVGVAGYAQAVDFPTLVRSRRTHKAYAPAPLDRATLDELFELARWAPNH